MDSTTADTFRQQERISYALFMNVNTSSTDFNFLWYCVRVSITEDLILHQPVIAAHEFCFTHTGKAYSLVTATHLSKRGRV